MNCAEVTLGFPGDLIPQGCELDCSVTKAGGQAVFPAKASSVADTLKDKLYCGVCKAKLKLIFQAYAPLQEQEIGRSEDARCLYVFGCIAEGCGSQEDCWRAVRVQKSIQEPSEAYLPTDWGAEADLQRNVTQPPVFFDWGLGSGTDVWGVQGPLEQHANSGEASRQESLRPAFDGAGSTTAAAAAFDFAELDAALDGMAAAEEVGPGPRPPGAGRRAESGSRRGDRGPPASADCLPEFYIVAGDEPGASDREPSESDRLHAQQLLERYERDSAAVSGSAEESWAGEEFEEERTLTVDTAGVRFMRRLQRAPEQCARYGFGAEVLWPSGEAPRPPPCSACGEPRVFELQLMPPLVHFLDEAADWARDGGGEPRRPPSSWSWGTVAVYTCRASCPPREGQALAPPAAEEWVCLAGE
mmetsp:Transcript_19793/g.47231  ORF Transcript_19793/g.47231 Transcript_19793/m.47231 type:complete len:415 (+) Transcript_19793:85-1329(+)